MSINKLISIRNPIVDAMDMLGLDHAQDMPIFTTWAITAEKNIDSYFQYQKKRAVIPIENCIAKLPADATHVQRAILGDMGCDCADLFNTICSTIPLSATILNASAALSTFLIVDIGSGQTNTYGSIPHVIQDNKIILNQNLNGQKLTVQYLGYKVDCDGFLEISQNHVQAIMWFIVWRYWYRKRNLSPMEQGKMNTAMQEWNRECANARAVDGVPTESEQEEIAQMLNDAYIGRGLSIGMRTTLSDFIW